MLLGPSGSGKTFLAKCIYDYCIQEKLLTNKSPFISLNCAQYYNNPELLSSELFGYVKGAFTGADKDKKGLLESADRGVLFLGLAVIIKIILSHTGIAISQRMTLLGMFLTWIIIDIGFLAMVIFMESPFFLEGFYKWKYPEEYRDWEGKSAEEWYGKKYLKKHKELLEDKNEEINL